MGSDCSEFCTDYAFGAPLDADVADVNDEAEHVLEFQLIKHFFIDLDRNLGPFPSPADANKQLKFGPLVKKLWNIQPVAIPNLDNAAGVGAALTPYYHVVNQFPTPSWKQDGYVRFDSGINAPLKANAWAGVSPAPNYNEIQLIDSRNGLAVTRATTAAPSTRTIPTTRKASSPTSAAPRRS
jgi:hypothetical protein